MRIGPRQFIVWIAIAATFFFAPPAGAQAPPPKVRIGGFDDGVQPAVAPKSDTADDSDREFYPFRTKLCIRLFDTGMTAIDPPATGGGTDVPQPPPEPKVLSTRDLPAGGKVTRYSDGSQKYEYTDGTTEYIAPDGASTHVRPGKTTIIRHADGKTEEVPPLSGAPANAWPALIQALIDQARCSKGVSDQIQQSDAGTVGTPRPSQESVKQVEEKKSVFDNPFGFGFGLGVGGFGRGDRDRPDSGTPWDIPPKRK